MKKIRLIALFVSVVMFSMNFVPTVVFATETETTQNYTEVSTHQYNKKIDPDELVPMLEKAEEGDKFTVWVWVVDKAKDDAICAEVRSRMIADGSWQDYTDPKLDASEATNIMITNDRKLQKEVYTQENPKIAQALKLNDDDIIEIGTQDPIFTLNITKSEIERIAESEYVTHIDYIDVNAVVQDQETLDEAKRDISETNVFLDGVEDRSGHGSLEITEIAKSYNGLPITLNIVIKDGDKTLEENVDYTAEYRNNINTGMADLNITGINRYTGTHKYHFHIMKVFGDIDYDGIVTSSDALAVLRSSVENKEFSESEMSNFDLDGDGTITSNDALIVLCKSVGYFGKNLYDDQTEY